jgi:predicted transcriptional regulator
VGEAGQRRAPGELESEVLAVLWTAETPRTPSQVHEELDAGLSYKTIHTILTRLHEKGLVQRVTHAGRSCYAAARDSAQEAADRMRAVLESGRDRRAILQRFVNTLRPADERALRALFNEDPPK